ncbi:MAG TPA: NAD(P)H-quinone oxidoreductase, partial [Plasticicumulans sp.]|nr:NAD(P)H-quinone oxidoreductase [Plasticicumulans sp.]
MPAVPATMNAVGIRTPGGPEVLQPCTRPVPQPRAGEVLIEVAAAGVNRPDCLQRAGAYPPPPGASDLPGLEVAGCVVAVERFEQREHLALAGGALVAEEL